MLSVPDETKQTTLGTLLNWEVWFSESLKLKSELGSRIQDSQKRTDDREPGEPGEAEDWRKGGPEPGGLEQWSIGALEQWRGGPWGMPRIDTPGKATTQHPDRG